MPGNWYRGAPVCAKLQCDVSGSPQPYGCVPGVSPVTYGYASAVVVGDFFRYLQPAPKSPPKKAPGVGMPATKPCTNQNGNFLADRVSKKKHAAGRKHRSGRHQCPPVMAGGHGMQFNASIANIHGVRTCMIPPQAKRHVTGPSGGQISLNHVIWVASIAELRINVRAVHEGLHRQLCVSVHCGAGVGSNVVHHHVTGGPAYACMEVTRSRCLHVMPCHVMPCPAQRFLQRYLQTAAPLICLCASQDLAAATMQQ